MKLLCYILGHDIIPTIFKDGSYGYEKQRCFRCGEMV